MISSALSKITATPSASPKYDEIPLLQAGFLLSFENAARSARKGERSEEMRARSAAAAEQDITAAASAKVGNKSRFEKAAVQLHSAAFNFPAASPTSPKRRQPNDSASLLTRALSSIGGARRTQYFAPQNTRAASPLCLISASPKRGACAARTIPPTQASYPAFHSLYLA